MKPVNDTKYGFISSSDPRQAHMSVTGPSWPVPACSSLTSYDLYSNMHKKNVDVILSLYANKMLVYVKRF